MIPLDSALSISAAVRNGDCSAEEIVGGSIDRIEALQSRYQAFLHHDRERALSQARMIDQRRMHGEALGPLAGVPLAIKDNMCTTFGATTCGSRILESFQSRYDAHVIERLESAGAIVIGTMRQSWMPHTW